MSDWMMVGLRRYVLRLPPRIGRKRLGQLAERARAEARALSSQHRAVHHFVVRELPQHGRPMSPQTIAEGLGIPTDAAISALTELEARKGFLFRNNYGDVVWAYPITEQTAREVRDELERRRGAGGAAGSAVSA